MLPLAASNGHNGGLIWGIVLLALGVVHLIFRGFYARRAQAIHDARQDTAPTMTRPFYRRHDASWYRTTTIILSVLFIAYGIVEIAAHA